MKKLSLYIFLILMFCNVGFANDISKIEDIEINGISIGDNLLDHFSKQEIIQNKEFLEANTTKQKLYYTSLINWEMFYYESNERVGMTEKPIYRIIGMELSQSCDDWKTGRYSKDESLRLLTKCIEKSFTKKLIKFDNTFLNLLDLYFEKKYKKDPEIQETHYGFSYVESTKLGQGCYSDNISIKYDLMIAEDKFPKLMKKKDEKVMNENKKNMYYAPGMRILLMSKELEQILYDKYC